MKRILTLILAITTATASAADWPRFHGSGIDNLSPDTGLLKAWPEGGPSRLWEASGIGEGYSSATIVGDRIFMSGAVGDVCVITALDMDGKIIWQQTNGESWAGSYPGTRSTPTIDDGLLYHLSGNGNLICVEIDKGEVEWTINILDEFGGRNIMWGLSESLLVIDDKVICSVGGEKVAAAALNKKTGDVIWTCEGTELDKPGYGSPVLVNYDGLGQIVIPMSESIFGVRASDGKRLWRYPHKVYTDQNITTPLYQDGHVIISACGRQGTSSLRLNVSGDECSVEQAWINETLDDKQGGLILLNDRIYGYAESQNRKEPWMCIDVKTGETIFQSAPIESSYKYRNGCLAYADGMFYLYTDDGNLALAKPTDTGFERTGMLNITDPGKNPTWAHPVVFGGRLYVRYGDRLGVYDVAQGD